MFAESTFKKLRDGKGFDPRDGDDESAIFRELHDYFKAYQTEVNSEIPELRRVGTLQEYSRVCYTLSCIIYIRILAAMYWNGTSVGL